MAAEGLDVVHVLTPPDSHVMVAFEALSLGCHVLVEKPLATSVEDCDRLIAESQARGLRVCVNHSLLGDPFVGECSELAAHHVRIRREGGTCGAERSSGQRQRPDKLER